MAADSNFSEVVFSCVDLNVPVPSTAEFRVPVTPADFTIVGIAKYSTFASAIAALFGLDDDTGLSQLGIVGVRLEMDLGIPAVTALPTSDPREIWEITSDAPDDFRLGLPGRNQRPALVVPGTKGQIANLTATPWVALKHALDGTTAAGVHLVDRETGSNHTIETARGTVRPRSRPRV